MNRLAVIVLNWNSADDSLECIDSLVKQSIKTDIIIVDNASSDDSVEQFKAYVAKSPNAVLVENSENLGFAGGINTGIRSAKDYEFIGILNPDAAADKDWAKQLINELDNRPDSAIATGLLLRRDGKTIDSSGDWYSKWGLAFPRNRDDNVSEAPKEAGYSFGATGGAVIYRRELFENIGLFDEKFFMYYEDVDLSFRAQLAGYKVRFTPKAIAYHKQGASTKKVPGLAVYQTFKNIPLLMEKNVPARLLPIVYPRLLLSYTLMLGRAIARGDGLPAIKGWSASLLLTPHALKQRKIIQNSRTVPVEYIGSIFWDDLPPDQTGLRKFRRFFTGK